MSKKRKEIYPTPEIPKEGWPWTEIDVEIDSCEESEWPRLTVIMPSYNQSEFIEESIRSVLLQSYPNLEFMIMDGGSTDKTINIIKKYEEWITHWESKEDRGQSHAINKGYARSTGEYVALSGCPRQHFAGALVKII